MDIISNLTPYGTTKISLELRSQKNHTLYFPVGHNLCGYGKTNENPDNSIIYHHVPGKFVGF